VDAKQLACAHTSLILANNFAPVSEALASFELHPTPSYVVKEMIGRYKAGAKI
jgi:hypothetical protein